MNPTAIYGCGPWYVALVNNHRNEHCIYVHTHAFVPSTSHQILCCIGPISDLQEALQIETGLTRCDNVEMYMRNTVFNRFRVWIPKENTEEKKKKKNLAKKSKKAELTPEDLDYLTVGTIKKMTAKLKKLKEKRG
jgi:hypothetical protein